MLDHAHANGWRSTEALAGKWQRESRAQIAPPDQVSRESQGHALQLVARIHRSLTAKAGFWTVGARTAHSYRRAQSGGSPLTSVNISFALLVGAAMFPTCWCGKKSDLRLLQWRNGASERYACARRRSLMPEGPEARAAYMRQRAGQDENRQDLRGMPRDSGLSPVRRERRRGVRLVAGCARRPAQEGGDPHFQLVAKSRRALSLNRLRLSVSFAGHFGRRRTIMGRSEPDHLAWGGTPALFVRRLKPDSRRSASFDSTLPEFVRVQRA